MSEEEMYRADTQQALALPQAPSSTHTLGGIAVRFATRIWM